jgi:hypothetical protein
MYSGFFALAGNELVNNSRTTAYSSTLGITSVQCAPCATLNRALWDLPYTSPDLDDAPWYDPAEPHSKEFAGLLGLEVVGLGRSTGSRAVVPLTRDGASLHPVRRAAREVQFRAIALARTEAALSYGLSWLASALRGGTCTTGCVGDSLCFFTACPPGCDPALPTDSNAQPECCRPSENPDLDPCGSPYWRQMLNVGLLAMETGSALRRVGSGWMTEVTITLTAGDPFIYREPTLMAAGVQASQIMPDYEDTGFPPDCFEAADCLRDPTCPTPPAPVLPPLPVDACYPSGPFTAGRVVMELPRDRVPIWAEKVPLIIISAGSSRIERLTLRWYGNPTGGECGDDLDPCGACAEVNVAFVPQGSTLTIDGRIEAAFVDCPGGPGLSTAEAQLYGRGGGPFVWPVFGCGDGMCVELITAANTVADDASIEIFYVVREDAA